MINDSVLRSIPFYTRKIVYGPTHGTNTVKLLFLDKIQSCLNDNQTHSKVKNSVGLMTWLTLWDLNKNEIIILDTFEWGTQNIVDEKTCYYYLIEPKRLPLLRMPNCLFFPKCANFATKYVSKKGYKTNHNSPKMKDLSNWHTSISDANIKKYLK